MNEFEFDMEPLMDLDGYPWNPTAAELDVTFYTPGTFPLPACEGQAATTDMALVDYGELGEVA